MKILNLGKEEKNLFSNTIALTILQGGNYLLPLITLPYLLRVLGPDKYGLIIFAQSLIQYFDLITQYGFNLSATRSIAINRSNKEKLNEIFNSVMIIKLILMFICFFLLIFLILIFKKFSSDYLVYLFTFGFVIGDVLFPVWYFQGMEKMRFITILNLLPKMFSTILIFVFIKDSYDFIWVPLINSSGMIISGILSIVLVYKIFHIDFKLPSKNNLNFYLKDGWHVFISMLAISLYTVTNTFVLGLFTNNIIVGYYGAAQKVVQAVENLCTPIQQSIYPYINNLIKKNKLEAVHFIKKITKWMGLFGIILSLGLLFFASLVIRIVSGEAFQQSIQILRILSFLPFIITVSNMLGTQTLLAFNFKRIFSMSIIIPSLLHIVLIFVVVPLFGVIGLAMLTIITESLIVIYRATGIYKVRNFFMEGSNNQ